MIPKYADAVVKVRMAGDITDVVSAGTARKPGDALSELRHPGLSQTSAATSRPTRRDPAGRPSRCTTSPSRWTTPTSAPTRRPDRRPPSLPVRPGQRAHVRFTLDQQPLVWQWARRFLQLIQTSTQPARSGCKRRGHVGSRR